MAPDSGATIPFISRHTRSRQLAGVALHLETRRRHYRIQLEDTVVERSERFDDC